MEKHGGDFRNETDNPFRKDWQNKDLRNKTENRIAGKEFKLLVHPRNVRVVKMDGKSIDHNIMRTTSVYLVVYMGIFVASFLLVSIEGLDLVTSFTSVAATLNNTGPGLAQVGPVGNYASMTLLSKIVLMFDMLAGRLELFPVLLLFIPKIWKKA